MGLLSPIQPANAAVSCGSVKSQVLKIEKKITTNLKWIKSQPYFISKYEGLGTTYTKNYYFETSSVEFARLEKVRVEVYKSLDALWRLGFNNPKCFLNTQMLWIKNSSFKHYANYIDQQTFDLSAEKTLFDDQEFMSRHEVVSVNNYKSIYKY